MTYCIELAKEAESDLDALLKADRNLFRRVLAKVEALSKNPLEGKPLVGNHKGEFSFRVGSYRIVYTLDTTRHVVYVLTVKHRRHVY